MLKNLKSPSHDPQPTPVQLTQEDRFLIDYHTTASGACQQLDQLIDEFVSEASSGDNIAVINELFLTGSSTCRVE